MDRNWLYRLEILSIWFES